jgi:hypothetical protein
MLVETHLPIRCCSFSISISRSSRKNHDGVPGTIMTVDVVST